MVLSAPKMLYVSCANLVDMTVIAEEEMCVGTAPWAVPKTEAQLHPS